MTSKDCAYSLLIAPPTRTAPDQSFQDRAAPTSEPGHRHPQTLIWAFIGTLGHKRYESLHSAFRLIDDTVRGWDGIVRLGLLEL